MVSADGFAETSRPARYLTQMCKHMTAEGMHVETTDGQHGHADFGWGTCTLRAQPDGLALHLQTRDAAMLERAQQALSSHLEQFGRRDNLTVTWTVTANH